MSPAGTKKTQRPIGTQKYCRFCERTENGRAAKQQYIALCPQALMVAPAVAHLRPGPPAHLQTARRNRPKKPSQDPSQNARWSPRRAIRMPENTNTSCENQICVPRQIFLCTELVYQFVYQFVYRDKDFCVPICVP